MYCLSKQPKSKNVWKLFSFFSTLLNIGVQNKYSIKMDIKRQQPKLVKFDKTVLAPYALKSQLTFDIDDF